MDTLNEKISPALSVIIPVYNVEQYLPECLDSVLNQSFGDFEIICVNDGSTDGSAKILEEYAVRDDRISVITRENQGVSEARNVGVRAAKGKYIYFMDSDDIINPDAFELCINDMETRSLEYLCFNAVAFGDNLEKILAAGALNRYYYRRYLNEDRIYTGQELFRELTGRGSIIVTPWSCMLLRTAITEHNLWFHPGTLHEDEYWMFSTLLSLSRCGCINKTLYKNRLRENSITQSLLSFEHVYGLLAASLDMRSFLAQHFECLDNAEKGAPEIRRMIRMQRRAAENYLELSAEERQKHEELPPEERIIFEQMVSFPASITKERNDLGEKLTALREKTSVLHKTNIALNERISALEQDKKALQKENKKLKAKNKKLKKSASYRIGRMLTLLPRKFKALLKKGKKSAPKTAVPKAAKTAVPKKVDRNIIWLLGTPEHPNMGDQLIAQEELNFIRAVLPDVKITEYTDANLRWYNFTQLQKIKPGQLVCLHGGGNLGTLWEEHEALRQRLITSFSDNPIIIFPQSIFFSDDEAGRAALAHAKEVYCGDNLTLFCRDKVSFDFAQEHFSCRSVLVPDIVMWRAQMPGHPTERYGALTLLRNDVERKFTDDDEAKINSVLSSKFDSIEKADTRIVSPKIMPDMRPKKIEMMLDMVSSSECVVTDRMHGMVLCAITGTPCVAFANGYHKVEACFNWLKDLGYISFIRDIDELDSAIESVMSCTDRTYLEAEMQRRFAPLKEALQNEFAINKE